MSPRLVSVVIPTRDRPDQLSRCLAACRDQRDVELEVVVVDDGSIDAVAVRRVAEAHPARLVRLDGRGPAAARNAGIAASGGAVVLLIDDDCIPEPSWAAELSRGGAAGEGLAVGRTIHDPGRPLVVASELIVGHAERRDGFAATRNVGIRRDIALEVPFDERFRTAGGEDREWCRRLVRRGTALEPAPAAVVRHDLRIDIAGFLRQHARYGRGARIDDEREPGSVSGYRRLVADGFRRGPRVGALVILAQAATAVGYATGDKAA